ncbi:MAG: recombinase family protein [Oscillospiraceae bacterium]|nr:recombinase family protein [Oscillospiraceae bacterium]
MNQNCNSSELAASQDAGKRAWIYIRVARSPDPYYETLEDSLRSYASEQEFTLTGFSIDFNSKNGGHGLAQMLQAAKDNAFDVLLIKSMDQLNTTLLMSLDIMTCLDNQGIKVWSPGRGCYDIKKMATDYDVDRFLDDLEERRYSRELRESYLGDCEPEDYDGDDYDDDYHPEAWEKNTL